MRQKTRILIYILIAITAVIMGTLAILQNHQAADKPVTAQEHIDLGRIYLTELSYEKAVLEFTEAIEIEPLNPDAYLGRAEAYVGMGDTEKAVEVLEEGFDKTGDGRIRDMLEKMQTDAIITSLVSEKEEMETLYIPISVKHFSKYNSTDIGSNIIPADKWNYYVQYDSNGNTTYVSLCKQKYERIDHLGVDVSISYYNDLFNIWIDGSDNKFINIPQPSPAFSYCNKDGDLLWYTETEYDENFRIIKQNYYNGNGYFSNYERYVYTPEGNISECYHKYGENDEYLYYDCVYDSNKKIATETHYYENGTSYFVSSYKYDANQNLISKTDNWGDTGETTYEYDLNGNLIKENHNSGTINYESTYKYDLNNNVIENTWKSGDVSYKYFYDTNGNKIKDITYDINGSVSSKTQYKYDSNNNRIWSYWEYDTGTHEELYTYDFNGNLIKEKYVHTHEDGEVYEHTYTYSYIYDSDGRIVEKTTTDEDKNEISNVTKYTYDLHGNLLNESKVSSNGEEYESNSYEYVKIELSKDFIDRCINK